MKTLIIFLCSIPVFAQTQYPDTLYLLSDKSYPCLFTDINETKVEFIYANEITQSTVVNAIEKILLENHGTVYSTSSGFTKNLSQLQKFVNERFQIIKDNKLAKEEELRLSYPLPKLPQQVAKNDIDFDQTKNNEWSFGVLYIPYYSGKIYTIISSHYPPYTFEPYGLSDNEINMEAQLSFAVSNSLRLTLDVNYNSSNYERRDESHSRTTNITEYDNGNLTKENLALIDINLGIKYYFKPLLQEKVSIYALLGFGKKFASADQESKPLFQNPPPSYVIEDNLTEFVEDANSPFHFNIGFGAEYFFNESLSLTSNIRFIYSSIKAKYDSRQVSDYETYTSTIDYKKADFITRIGIGVNFYF